MSDKILKYIPIKKMRNYAIEIIDFIETPNIYKDFNKIKDTVNKLVWYIPFRNLRNIVREIILYILETKRRYSNNYFINHFDFKNIYDKLTNGLNNEDIKLIDNLIYKSFYNKTYLNKEEFNKLIKVENEHNTKIKYTNDDRYIYDNKYILIGSNSFEIINFYDRMFIDTLSNQSYFKNKAIIDAGAWIGDTALVLSEYTNDKVYAFEPVPENINTMKEIIEINKKYNIIPVCLALGDDNKKMEAFISGTYSYFNENMCSNKNKIELDMVTLDKFVEDNNLEVGLIKTDLEGFEQPFLRGAINTIKKQKPTLIISIYHSYEDFFEIKPMIESWNLGYKFSIKKGSEFHEIVGTLLIAEIQ